VSDQGVTPPHNLEAERAVLGACMTTADAWVEASGLLVATDFYRYAHRRIFEAMLRLSTARVEIDLVTVKNELLKANALDDVDGPAYLASLTDGVPRSTNVAHYAGIVKQKAALRTLIAGANEMLKSAYDTSEAVDEILGKAEQTILGLSDLATTQGFESIRTIALRGMDAIEHAAQHKAKVLGVPSGFRDIDDLTLGWRPGKLIAIAARPGVGKSSFAGNVAVHAAIAGYPTGICSLEMEKDELFTRQLSSLARIDGHRLTGGYLSDLDWSRIATHLGTLAEAPLFIDETPAVSLLEIKSRARRLKAEHGLKLLVVDYLQLMRSSEKRENRTLELATITGGLKALAKELKIPVLMLSQLSRDVERRGGRPRLSDLRDSGSIEQDSDIVIFLHRELGPDGQMEGPTDVIIAKHRGGPVGTVRLSWIPEHTRFESMGLTA